MTLSARKDPISPKKNCVCLSERCEKKSLLWYKRNKIYRLYTIRSPYIKILIKQILLTNQISIATGLHQGFFLFHLFI